MTFSKKVTKITRQTHIRKIQILHFSDNITKIPMIPNFFCSKKCTALWNQFYLEISKHFYGKFRKFNAIYEFVVIKNLRFFS